MKTKNFYDLNHASNYLVNSMIRVDDEPVIVNGFDHSTASKIIMSYYAVNNKKIKTVPINSDRVNLSPVPLGFLAIRAPFNAFLRTAYTCRYPSRRWKVGLTQNNIGIIKLPKSKDYFSQESVFYSTELRDTVLGLYLKFEEALDLANRNNGIDIPFSRVFATNGTVLYYKAFDQAVGQINGTLPVLHDDFRFLNERLQEDLNA